LDDVEDAQDAPATMPAVSADATATPVGIPPTVEVGESVKGDAPKPPETAPDVVEDAETPQEPVHAAQAVVSAAQDAPQPTPTPALDTEAMPEDALADLNEAPAPDAQDAAEADAGPVGVPAGETVQPAMIR
jgi:hypothetical protein